MYELLVFAAGLMVGTAIVALCTREYTRDAAERAAATLRAYERAMEEIDREARRNAEVGMHIMAVLQREHVRVCEACSGDAAEFVAALNAIRRMCGSMTDNEGRYLDSSTIGERAGEIANRAICKISERAAKFKELQRERLRKDEEERQKIEKKYGRA